MDILHLAHGDAPAAFAVALRTEPDGRATLLGSGRGLTPEEAMASCLGEAAEGEAASAPDALTTFRCGRADLPGLAIPANRFWQFSGRQLRSGPHRSEAIPLRSWAAARQVIRSCRSWCEARPAGEGAPAFVPLAVVLPGGPTDSNGLAAGRTREDARRAALLELVERDAVAIWWYGRISRPAMPIDRLDAAGGADLRRWLQARTRRTWLLDLTHDLGVPVAAAIAADPDGSTIAYGFAAHPDPARAGLSACLEMLQSELSLALSARRASAVGAPEGKAGRYLVWSRSARLAGLPHLQPQPDAAAVAPENPAVDPLPSIAERSGLPILFVDLDRPGDELKVVRALAPGLRPGRPRFRRGRLDAVPRRLGWAYSGVDEAAVDEVILI